MEKLADNAAFLGQLEYVSIAARRLFDGRLLGQRRSKRFGAGLEYADFRPYAPGDDLRRLHWPSYLLHRRLISKLYEETTEMMVYLLVDTSASMGRGTPEKLLYAKKLAAALAYVSLGGLDRVVVLPFATDPSTATPLPLQGRSRFGEVLRLLDGLEPSGQTDLEHAVRFLAQRYQRRGLCVILSDFFDTKGYESAIKALHNNRFVVTTIRINEPEELEPTLRGDLEIVDCETGESQLVQLSPSAIAAYRRELERHYGTLVELSRAFGQQHAAARTDTPFHDFLVELFRQGILVR